MIKTAGNERRECPRFVFDLPLEINHKDFHVAARTRNISCSGIFCDIDKYIPLKTKITVKIKLSLVADGRKIKKILNFPAKIARIEQDKGRKTTNFHVGIRFASLRDKNQEYLLQFIQQKNVKEAKQLKKMYLDLKEMEAKLVELEEGHPTAKHFRKVIEKAVSELDTIAHILDHEINELKTLD
ncbi:MAG: PilZ domain-containing protein [Candidatus Omnitrophica bacterium]|nr:PilZ domain-containing protein [Candidatus Omnitrophota bacterium]MBU1925414.1 PilZ domain-containing protein [Candidatus Omnitrophota bacterium]